MSSTSAIVILITPTQEVVVADAPICRFFACFGAVLRECLSCGAAVSVSSSDTPPTQELPREASGARLPSTTSTRAESGRVLISGIQAIVRLMLDQRRLDAARGLDTRDLRQRLPGFPAGRAGPGDGSRRPPPRPGRRGLPARGQRGAGRDRGGRHPAAAAVPGRRHDGVIGFWYGKNPGLDRAADAIRHANLVGHRALGGAVALIGDDPASKSSTVPSACEQMCAEPVDAAARARPRCPR